MIPIRSQLRAFALLAGLWPLGLAAPALACACCSDIGQRLESQATFASGTRAEFLAARYGINAELFRNAGFPDNVEGVTEPQTRPYRLRVTADASALGSVVFDLTDATGKGGRIAFPLPSRLERLAVDIRDGKKSDGGGPLLYHEWRIRGPVSLSGILGRAGKRATATLILQGRGNLCATPDAFDHWTLVVAGQGIAFTLLGALR